MKLTIPISRYSILSLLFMCCVIVTISCSDDSVGGNDDIVDPPLPVQTEIDTYPAWSPDGSKIIFLRNRSNYADTQWVWGVFIHDVASGHDSLLWQNLRAQDFDWSPDGSKIAFCLNATIHISNLLGTESIQIASAARSWSPRWSPNGQDLMYCIRLGVDRGAYLFNLTDSTTELIVPYATDGDWITQRDSVAVISFNGADFGKLAVYSFEADSTYDLPYIDNYKRFIAPLLDSQTILISRDGGANYTNIWKLNLVSRTYTQLTSEGGDYPAWSSDGRWIAYTRLGPDNGHLWLMRPDGSDKHQITF